MVLHIKNISRDQINQFFNDSWKSQGAENAKVNRSRENFGASWIVFAMFFGILLNQTKNIKERVVL